VRRVHHVHKEGHCSRVQVLIYREPPSGDLSALIPIFAEEAEEHELALQRRVAILPEIKRWWDDEGNLRPRFPSWEPERLDSP
jgi:hypothetical protein